MILWNRALQLFPNFLFLALCLSSVKKERKIRSRRLGREQRLLSSLQFYKSVPAMDRNLSQVIYRELENLDKHPDRRREAMKALKSYVKDLDSKAIPTFLARVSETKEPGSASGECTISLFEVLARSHGCNIVPYIDNMLDIIMKILLTSAGSFALHQACSKVVSTIIRHGINPLIPESEKTGIIRSLCKPFYDVLMVSQESTASGAALCLTALVESDNWRFASDDIVNEICLKVAGALGETRTQTNSHMGLVMVLSKHNSLIADAYSRSFIRSGLQILTSGVETRNFQKRLPAVQMINFIMKFVDSRSISSEIGGIIAAMEKSQNDHMPFVRGAAFEALQTAKIIAEQKVSQHEVSSSPILGLNFERRTDRNNSQAGSQVNAEPGDSTSSSSSYEFPTQELQSVDSFDDYDTHVDSPFSIGQSSCSIECGGRAGRRLWNNDGWNQGDHSHRDEVQRRGDIRQSVRIAEPMTTRAKIWQCSKVFLSFICGLLIIILAIILSDNDETVYVVPT